MDLKEFNDRRTRLNSRMTDEDSFFATFGALDDEVYAEGAIPKRDKELIGLAISVATRCDECMAYHLQGCQREGVKRAAVVEAIKLGVIAGGSLTYPTARAAFSVLEQLDI